MLDPFGNRGKSCLIFGDGAHTGDKLRGVLAFSLGYFIMLLSTLGGLKNVDRDLLLMSRLFGASELRLFRRVRIPWTLPGIFGGLRLTLIYCSAGAVIGEL